MLLKVRLLWFPPGWSHGRISGSEAGKFCFAQKSETIVRWGAYPLNDEYPINDCLRYR